MITNFNPLADKSGLNTELREKTVLFIDDSVMSLEIYKAYMKNAPFRCVFCSDSLEAKRIITEQKVDGIVSDLSMPNLSGLDIFNSAKELNPNCFKMMVTGNTDMASIIYAVNEIGINKILLKPVQLKAAAMIELLTDALNKSRDQ
ncbi:MAG: response regulator [Bdellovibrionales bacterium]|nr:response regulator [Bdellovibrionales bacterium]